MKTKRDHIWDVTFHNKHGVASNFHSAGLGNKWMTFDRHSAAQQATFGMFTRCKMKLRKF